MSTKSAALMLLLLASAQASAVTHQMRVAKPTLKVVAPASSGPTTPTNPANPTEPTPPAEPVASTNWKVVPAATWAYGAAYGAGKFVIMGTNGIFVSNNGADWTRLQPVGVGGTWDGSKEYRSVIYTGTQFIAVGISVPTAMSSDGQTWRFGNIPGGGWNSIAYGNGVYVTFSTAQSTGQAVAYSPDGSAWYTRGSPQPWTRVAFGNGVFVAGSDSASTVVGISTNGSTWEQQSLPVAMSGPVHFVNGKFFRFTGTTAYTSTNGRSWSASPIPLTFNGPSHVAYGGGRYLAISYSQAITSTDGVTWTQIPMPSGTWTGLAYGNGRFVASSAVGHGIAYTE